MPARAQRRLLKLSHHPQSSWLSADRPVETVEQFDYLNLEQVLTFFSSPIVLM